MKKSHLNSSQMLMISKNSNKSIREIRKVLLFCVRINSTGRKNMIRSAGNERK